MLSVYDFKEDYFDDLIGYIGALSKWSIFKKRPSKDGNAKYIFLNIKMMNSIWDSNLF